jgi:hypothetical protein
MFADSTKATYRVHLRSFLAFCQQYGLTAVPASTNTLIRYATFLARSKTYHSVSQYMNIIRILHEFFGLNNPLSDNWALRALLQGVKRGKGTATNSKAPLLPPHLKVIHSKLDLSVLEDLQFWAALLCAFFGLLRVGNITGPHSVCRRDLLITSDGIVLSVRHSKTIQQKQRVHRVVLPFLGKTHSLCPVTALLTFVARTPLHGEAPLFAIPQGAEGFRALTAGRVRGKLRALSRLCPELPQCSSHSLRRGGATWLLACKVPVATIKILGDWASDAVYRYLQPDTKAKFQVMSKVTASI